jgi:hypothetical protein
MNPHYLWLTEGLELITFFVGVPMIALGIAYAAWRSTPQSLISRRSRAIGIVSGVTAFLLFGLARWIHPDPRDLDYFLYLICVLAGLVLIGIFMGCGFCEMLRLWQWHRRTALKRGL